jgi:VWFA-related protein
VRHNPIRRSLCGLALAATAVLAAAQSAPPQDPPQQPPKFRVETNFVRIDAYPTKAGTPVLGLRAEDFEVFEDNVLQKIETFEHVVVRPAGPQTERVEPNSQRDAIQAASNPRNRVFVIFLDTPNVSIAGAHTINEPLIRLIDRILGPDDLVGVMTPAMNASQIVFARKTIVIEDSLRRNWAWGDRFTLQRDAREQAYVACYPPLPMLDAGSGNESYLAKEMIARKRERATFEAIEDLVRHLRTVREERKAVLTVTEGWIKYRRNLELLKLREDQSIQYREAPPTLDPVTVGPGGKLTTKDPRDHSFGTLTKSECDVDRMTLAHMDNDQYFRDILDAANYANASFYPIDPRGLAAWDAALGPDKPPPMLLDQAILRERIETMKTLALNTDGIAVVHSNDLDHGLRRISDDLSSYYLMGYYSTNTKLDGRFRNVKVRVKQPGVEVRARRGYRAPTEAEVTAARRADVPIPEATAAINSAIGKLSRIRPDARFRINVGAGGGSGSSSTIWIAGELQGKADEFAQGATADINAVAGGATTTARVALKAGERTFLTSIELPPTAKGPLEVRARLVPSDNPGLAQSDAVRLENGAGSVQPLLFRRGLSTGNRVAPAADFRFSRTERLRAEVPVGANVKAEGARLLDRTGQPLALAVTPTERTDEATSQRWIGVEINLAPLSPGEYAIELTLAGPPTERILTAIRVTR